MSSAFNFCLESSLEEMLSNFLVEESFFGRVLWSPWVFGWRRIKSFLKLDFSTGLGMESCTTASLLKLQQYSLI